MSDDVVMEIRPSIFRRWMALIALGGLSIILLGVAIGDLPDLWRLFFVLIAVWVLWSGNRLRLSTLNGLVLTRSALSTSTGEVLVKVENIQKVERGVFAFKPSNGFLVRLIEPAPKGWAPGLWWRFGTRLGVGGTLSGGQSRAMADLMSALVLERDSEN